MAKQGKAPDFYTTKFFNLHNPSAPGGYSSYSEGWGLYAESLGLQMAKGVYQEDIQVWSLYCNFLLGSFESVIRRKKYEIFRPKF